MSMVKFTLINGLQDFPAVLWAGAVFYAICARKRLHTGSGQRISTSSERANGQKAELLRAHVAVCEKTVYIQKLKREEKCDGRVKESILIDMDGEDKFRNLKAGSRSLRISKEIFFTKRIRVLVIESGENERDLCSRL